MLMFYVCFLWVCVCVKLQGYSPNNLNGDDFDDPLGLDISYFQTNPWNSIITYIYIHREEVESTEGQHIIKESNGIE